MNDLRKNPDLCIGCHECENICSKTWFKERNLEKSCIRIKKNDTSFNIIACTQCGECLDICPANAIYRDKNSIIRIDKNLCVGCFICVGFCPEGAIFMHRDYDEPFKCTVCGQCVKVCPTKALEIIEDKR